MIYTHYYRYSVSCLQYTKIAVLRKAFYVFVWSVNSLLFRPLEVGIYKDSVYPCHNWNFGAVCTPGHSRNFCKFCTPWPPSELLWVLYARSTINTRNFCEFGMSVSQYPELLLCATLIPVPGTSLSAVRSSPNTRGTGTPFVYLPGTSVSSVRRCHNTRNFCEFCKGFIPVPGTFVTSVLPSFPYPELL